MMSESGWCGVFAHLKNGISEGLQCYHKQVSLGNPLTWSSLVEMLVDKKGAHHFDSVPCVLKIQLLTLLDLKKSFINRSLLQYFISSLPHQNNPFVIHLLNVLTEKQTRPKFKNIVFKGKALETWTSLNFENSDTPLIDSDTVKRKLSSPVEPQNKFLKEDRENSPPPTQSVIRLSELLQSDHNKIIETLRSGQSISMSDIDQFTDLLQILTSEQSDLFHLSILKILAPYVAQQKVCPRAMMNVLENVINVHQKVATNFLKIVLPDASKQISDSLAKVCAKSSAPLHGVFKDMNSFNDQIVCFMIGAVSRNTSTDEICEMLQYLSDKSSPESTKTCTFILKVLPLDCGEGVKELCQNVLKDNTSFLKKSVISKLEKI